MNMKKYGIILVLMISFLVGVSSAGFLDQDVTLPSWATIGDTGHYGSLISWDAGWLDPGYLPVNISEWLHPETKPAEPVDPFASWNPAPVVLPDPLPMSKADLFGSLSTVSKQKQTLISSLKGGYYPG